jgi:nitrite reductase (NADH) small subunit
MLEESEEDEFALNINRYPSLEIQGIEYIDLCASKDLSIRKGTNFYFDKDIQVAVFHSNGLWYAVSNICPHQYAAVLCDGLLEEDTITCPLHGWIYSLETGKALGSNARLKTYQILESNGRIYLEKPRRKRALWLDNF